MTSCTSKYIAAHLVLVVFEGLDDVACLPTPRVSYLFFSRETALHVAEFNQCNNFNSS